MTPAGQPTSESDPPPNPGPSSPNEPGGIFTANLKGVELANLVGDTLDEVTAAAERGDQRIRGTPHLALSFLRHCGLSRW
jgi:hypothetical protein